MVNYSGDYATPRLDLREAVWEYLPGLVNFTGLQAFPTFRTSKKAATFPRITVEGLLKVPKTRRAPRAGYNRASFSAKDDSYACLEDGLEGQLDDSERELYASDFDAEMVNAIQVMHKIKLGQEKRVAAATFNVTTWLSTNAALYTSHSGAAWATTTNPIIDHVMAAKQKVKDGSGLRPNALIINDETLNNILQNDQILARFNKDVITEEDLRNNLAKIFGLQRLIVGDAAEDTADENQDASLSDVWGATYAMVARVCAENDPITEPCIGRTFQWVSDAPENEVVESYREKQTRSDIVRVRQHVVEKTIIPELGHLMKIAA